MKYDELAIAVAIQVRDRDARAHESSTNGRTRGERVVRRVLRGNTARVELARDAIRQIGSCRLRQRLHDHEIGASIGRE
jgi:hypothetical protein